MQEMPGSMPGWGRSPGGGHGNPLQYSCLENPRGQKSLVGYRPCSHRVGHDWSDPAHTHDCMSHTYCTESGCWYWHKAKWGGGRECEAGCSVLKGGQGRSSWEADIWSKTLGDKGVSRGAPQEKRLLSTTAGSGWRWGGNVRVPCGRKSRKHTLKSSLSIHQPDPN